MIAADTVSIRRLVQDATARYCAAANAAGLDVAQYARIKPAAGQKSFDWDESKHPRAADGRFGSGGVGNPLPSDGHTDDSQRKKSRVYSDQELGEREQARIYSETLRDPAQASLRDLTIASGYGQSLIAWKRRQAQKGEISHAEADKWADGVQREVDHMDTLIRDYMTKRKTPPVDDMSRAEKIAESAALDNRSVWNVAKDMGMTTQEVREIMSEITEALESYKEQDAPSPARSRAMAKQRAAGNDVYALAEMMQNAIARYASRDDLQDRIEAAADHTDTEPSPAEIEAGNYQKGKFWVWGLQVTIETPAGTTRRGTDRNGKEWSHRLPYHYGYIRRTKSAADGDQVDVFIGPDPASEILFVVDQQTPGGRFDEHKVMLGWTNEREAKQAYLDSYTPGWQGFGGITAMTVPDFVEWLDKGDTGKRVAQYALAAAMVDEMVARYADEKPSEKWVTIGGEAEDGKKHVGGSPVKIDGDGNILAGPQWLADKGVKKLGESSDKKESGNSESKVGDEAASQPEHSTEPAKPQEQPKGQPEPKPISDSARAAHEKAKSHGRTAKPDAEPKHFTSSGLEKGDHGFANGSIRTVGGKRYLQIDRTPRSYWSRSDLEDNDDFDVKPGGRYGWTGIEIEPTAEEASYDKQVAEHKASVEHRKNEKKRIINAVQKAENIDHRPDMTGMKKLWGESRAAGSETLYGDGKRLAYVTSSYDDPGYTWIVNDPKLAQDAESVIGPDPVPPKPLKSTLITEPDPYKSGAKPRSSSSPPRSNSSPPTQPKSSGGSSSHSDLLARKAANKQPLSTRGSTFANKEALKAAGARWNAERKSWDFDVSKLSNSQLAKLQSEMARLEGKGVEFYALVEMLGESLAQYGQLSLFKEDDHPRDAGGKFSTKTGGGKTVNFVPHPHASKEHETVMVDTEALDKAWKAGGLHIPPGGEEIAGRRAGVEKFLQTGKPVQAPKVYVQPNGSVVFGDGRHRFAVLRDSGAKQVAVTLDKGSAGKIGKGIATAAKPRPELVQAMNAALEQHAGKSSPSNSATSSGLTSGQKVRVAGAEFTFVRDNPDGTITVRNSSGSEFPTDPGEQWTALDSGPAAVQPRKLHEMTRKEAIAERIKELSTARQKAVDSTAAELESLAKKSGVRLPVGISAAQYFESKGRLPQDVKAALTRHAVARRNAEVSTGADERTVAASHRQAVEKALASGQTVSSSVLADYPDLAKNRSAPPPAIEGMQKSLFGGGDLRTGQKSLFNVALPGKKPAKPAQRPAAGEPAQINPLDQFVPQQEPSLPGQRSLYQQIHADFLRALYDFTNAPEHPPQTHTSHEPARQSQSGGKHAAGWKKVGGSSVHVNSNGTIDAGCPGLKGEDVDDLIDEPDESRERREHRQAQAEARGIKGHEITAKQARALEGGERKQQAWQRMKELARQHGVSASRVMQHVGDVLQSHQEFHAEREAGKKLAREMAGMTAGDAARFENSGRDWSSMPHFDEAADEFINNQPHLGIRDPQEFWDFIREGARPVPQAWHDSVMQEAAQRAAHSAEQARKGRPRSTAEIVGDAFDDWQHEKNGTSFDPSQFDLIPAGVDDVPL